jgi:hypothetical protein
MNGRERIEAAFSLDGSRDLPAVLSCYDEIYWRDHWDDLTTCPWWYQYVPDIERQIQWRRDVIRNTPQDWFRLPFCASREERSSLAIEVRPAGVFRIDRRTGKEEEVKRDPIGGWPDAEGYSQDASLPRTAGEIDELIPTASGIDPFTVINEGRNELASRLLGEFGQSLYPTHRTQHLLGLFTQKWGYEGTMVMIATRPDLVRHACQRFLTLITRRVRRAAILGVRGMWIVESLVDMISPEAFASLFAPFMTQVVGEIRAAGMNSIYYFTGNPAGKWDEILSIGADALALEEGKKGFEIDIEDVVKRVQGRCTVFGNLDAIGVLQNGTDEELRTEISRQIAAGRRNGNRFIMSIGSPVTPGTPVERVRLFCDLVQELGRS